MLMWMSLFFGFDVVSVSPTSLWFVPGVFGTAELSVFAFVPV